MQHRLMAEFYLFLLTLASLSGCDRTLSEPDPQGPVAAVELSADTLYLVQGDSVSLEVELRDSTGTALRGRPVEWSYLLIWDRDPYESHPPASIDSTSMLRAMRWSQGLVVATSEGVADTAFIQVEPDAEGQLAWTWNRPAVLSPGVSLLAEGRIAYQRLIRPFPTEPRWSSSNPSVISVRDTVSFYGPNTRIAAVSPGTAVLTMTFGGASLVDTIAVESVEFVMEDSRGRCGLDRNGEVWCKGSNHFGELGSLTATVCLRDCNEMETRYPIKVDTDFRATQLAAGQSHECALTTEGAVYCWGNNVTGQLGTATGTEHCVSRYSERLPCSFKPVPIAGGITFVSIEAYDFETCATTAEGRRYCWGGRYGERPILQP